HYSPLGGECGEPQRRREAARDGATVRQRVARRGLERVAEGVAEIELVPRPAIVRILDDEGRLERRAGTHLLRLAQLPQRLPGEQAGLDDLGEAVPPLVVG